MGQHRATPPARRRARAAKLRALLIGGLVIGVGSAVTLAAWTDTEDAKGTFGTSVFGIVGATNGSAFSEHPSGNAASLAFAATAMSPGAPPSFASFDVRTTPGTTVAGTLALTNASVSGNALITDKLVYRVATVPLGTACSAATYSGTATKVGAVFPVPNAALSAAGGNTVRYCFEVTLDSTTQNEAQGQSGSATWTFTATSAT